MPRLAFFRLTILLLAVFATCHDGNARNGTVVADGRTRRPLAGASAFDRQGRPAGVCNASGRLPCMANGDYPVTVRCVGYREATIGSPDVDTVFLTGSVTVLPEVVVNSRKRNVLHLVGYVREYSTLSTFTDTVFMFREKMVDYMIPTDRGGRFKGWSTPRVLVSRSFYRFTDAAGRDSVSDRSSHHFSWADWVGVLPRHEIPARLRGADSATDTVMGRYSPTELWTRDGDRVTLDLDVLADSTGRKWVPNLGVFFRSGMDFDRFTLRYAFDGSVDRAIEPCDLTGYSFTIESNGRGRGVYVFAPRDASFSVSTSAEVYIVDREYITTAEARKWEKNVGEGGLTEIYEAADAPDLHPSILRLMERVNGIDHLSVRTGLEPNRMLVAPPRVKLNLGQSILQRLKGMFGLDMLNAERKWRRNWNEFRRSQSRH